MKGRHYFRPLLASAALAAAVVLSGCNTDTDPIALSGRANQPLSDRMLADIEQKSMAKDSAILVRIFKEEAELEVWKEDKTGRLALLKTYPICRWSGELGPKVKEGDRQAPEGFYMITPGLMNPNSNFYLAINMGFPNAYDKSHGRSGGFLMIHGDCSSRGCYAMTDEQIAEIYALARESFFGGQRAFQIQAYPFRMTPLNMAKHRNSPHMAFWKMLKQGYDHFEVTRLEPQIDVCERRYVFNAESNGKFSPADRCPAYRVPQDIAEAVRDKQRRDDVQIAELSNRGVPTAPIRTGTDGGMNQTYLSAVKQYGGPGATIRTAAGTIPAHVNPPGPPVAEFDREPVQLRVEARPRAADGPGRVRDARRWFVRHRRLLQRAVRFQERYRGRRPGRSAGAEKTRRSSQVRACSGRRQAEAGPRAGSKDRSRAARAAAAAGPASQRRAAARAGSSQAREQRRPAQRRRAYRAGERFRKSIRRLALTQARPIPISFPAIAV